MSGIPLLAEEGWPRQQTRYREASLLERTGWSDRYNVVAVRRTDHPVCAEQGGFASVLLTAHPPLLCEEGNATRFQARPLLACPRFSYFPSSQAMRNCF